MSTHKHRHDPDSRRKRFAEPTPHRPWSWNAIIVAGGALFLGVAILTFARSSSGVSVTAPVVKRSKQVPILRAPRRSSQMARPGSFGTERLAAESSVSWS